MHHRTQHKNNETLPKYILRLTITCLSLIADNIFSTTVSCGWLHTEAVPLLEIQALHADII